MLICELYMHVDECFHFKVEQMSESNIRELFRKLTVLNIMKYYQSSKYISVSICNFIQTV